MGLKNPIGKATREVYVYLDSPESAARIRELENALSVEQARSAQVVEKEVVREVVKQDESLLHKLNETQRELGKLRADISKGGANRVALQAIHAAQSDLASIAAPQIEIREVEVVRVKRVVDFKSIAIAVLASLALGAAAGHFFSQTVAPRDIRLEQEKTKEEAPKNGSRGPLLKQK